jgi:hypothetical protein
MNNQGTTDNCDSSGWCVSVCGQDGRKMDQEMARRKADEWHGQQTGKLEALLIY